MSTGPARAPWRRRLLLPSGVLALLATAELVCRFGLGLGTPPLYEADAGFEYRLRPEQDVYRFGNHVFVNRWGMRSAEFDEKRTDPAELRVLVVGDSVVNGGSQIDQSALSTTLLQHSLQAALGRPVLVGNVSAGSWGPGNWLAYTQRFGFFDANVVVLVAGSGDHADNPTFAPLGPDHPTQAPMFALQEAAQRYLPRYLPSALQQILAPAEQNAAPSGQTPAEASAQGLADLEAFLNLARRDGRLVAVLHHPDREELASGVPMDGYAQIRALVLRLSLPFTELGPHYRTAGAGVYRDNVHHSAQGQQVMARVLHDVVLAALDPASETDRHKGAAGASP